MDVKKYFLSSFIFISCIVLTVSIILKSKFHVTKNKRINATSYGEAVAQSTAACSAVCQSSRNCMAANYVKELRKCFLFNLNSVLLEDAFGWKYFSRPQALRTFKYVSNESLTWRDSKLYCESLNGRLANIMTIADYDIILSILNQFGSPNDLRVWLGGSDISKEGRWIWTNGLRFRNQNFDFWAGAEPNNGKNNEDCLGITNLRWNDMNCERQKTFICEFFV